MTSHGKLTTKPVVQLCLAMKLLQFAVAQTFILGDTEIYTRMVSPGGPGRPDFGFVMAKSV